MNIKEKEIMKKEEDLKDSIENQLAIQEEGKNHKTAVKDIKLVGQIEWKDKINGQILSENVFEVETEITEIDDEGKERKITEIDYYLGDKCIGGTLGQNQIIYKESFKNSEPDKLQAIEDLLERVTDKEKEEFSLNRLHKKELAEVLSAKYGREVSEEEVEKLLQEMDKEEIEELKEDEEQEDIEEKAKKKDKKDENELTEKQVKKIKVNSVQKADLNKKVDGVETLGKRLDLQEYDDLYVVYSDKVNEVTPGTKRNSSTYSLVGMTKSGEARVLDNEFEIDSSVGNVGGKTQTKIKADDTATRDNKDSTVLRRKSNGTSIGCENNQGRVNMYFYSGKTREENENVGIQIETSNVYPMDRETQRLMSRKKGNYQIDKIQDEVKEHTDEGHNPDSIEYYDGDKKTGIDEHSIDIDKIVDDIYDFDEGDGEKDIQEQFSKNEIKQKLIREIEENKDRKEINEIIDDVKYEMDKDAENFSREQKR